MTATNDRRLRHSAQAEAKIIPLLCYHYISSRPAVKPQDWRATSLISLSSMFHSPTPPFALLSGTWSAHS